MEEGGEATTLDVTAVGVVAMLARLSGFNVM